MSDKRNQTEGIILNMPQVKILGKLLSRLNIVGFIFYCACNMMTKF